MTNTPDKDPKSGVRGDLGGSYRVLGLVGEIGWQLALPLVVFMIIGIKLDRAAHTTPLFMLLGIALAMTTSVILIIRLIARVTRGNK